MLVINLLFILCLIIVMYTYIGYGFLIALLVFFKKLLTKSASNYSFKPHAKISILIAAYNEEASVKEKMQNTTSLLYPKELLEIVWITDGSNDNTVQLLKNYPQVRVLHQSERQGKTAALNRAVPFLSGDIIVFTDANTSLNTEALVEISRPFANPKVGCVAGEKRILKKTKDSAAGGGEGLYWQYESLLKKLDSAWYTTVGAAGELFAIRKELFVPLPEDTLLDDFILSMTIAKAGYKIAYCNKAYALETPSLNIKEEAKRKERIAAGGIQSVIRLGSLFNVFKYPHLSFQYISHRVLRWTITPFALVMLLPLNILLVAYKPSCLVIFLLAIQVLFYLLGYLGYRLADKQIRTQLFYIPFYFFFMNFHVFKGLVYLIKNRNSGIWEKAKRE